MLLSRLSAAGAAAMNGSQRKQTSGYVLTGGVLVFAVWHILGIYPVNYTPKNHVRSPILGHDVENSATTCQKCRANEMRVLQSKRASELARGRAAQWACSNRPNEQPSQNTCFMAHTLISGWQPCSSVGVRLGRGEALPDILASSNQVAEGVATAGVVVTLARRFRVSLPVLTAVAQVGRIIT